MKKIVAFIILLLFSKYLSAQISFLPYNLYPVADGTVKICIADLNNDGLEDVVLASSYVFDSTVDYRLFLYFQNTLGMLDTPVTYLYPNHYPGIRAMACGDVNNDGLTDVVIGYSDTVGIFFQSASGILNPIVTYDSGQNVDGLKIGDLNNDGLNDIAVCHWNALYLKIFYQNSSSFVTKTYVKPQSGYDEFDIGDVNGDGRNDLVWAGAQVIGVKVFLQTSGDTLLPYITYMPPYHAAMSNGLAGIALGDLNNDGRVDVAATRANNSPNAYIVIWYQDTITGALQNPIELSAYDLPVPVEIADLDCDGRNEIIVGNTGWHSVTYYTQQANNSYGPYATAQISLTAQMNNSALAAGDFTNDGKPDIAAAVYDNGMITLINNSIPSSGMNELSITNAINIYPNPFTDNIYISAKRNELVEIKLFDITSRKIFNQSFKNSTSLNTSHLAKGLYLYEVRNKNGVIKKGKVVKD